MIWRKTGRLGTRVLAAAAMAGAITLAILPAPPAAHAQETVSIETFYEELAPHGNWVEHQKYGVVWYPTKVDDDWRPYTLGRWINTEEHGWLWHSDEDFGWAVYHYGRWAYDDDYGWIWVPGTEWGPAWVDWRRGDGYIGWTPLPPEVRWVNDRWDYAGVDFVAVRWRPNWVFVRDVHFVDYNLRRHCLPPAHNVTIIHRTQYATEYKYVNRVWVNRSVSPVYLQTVIKRPIPLIKIVTAHKPVERTIYKQGFNRPANITQISIYRPVIKIDPSKKPAHVMPLIKTPPKIVTPVQPPTKTTAPQTVITTPKPPGKVDPRVVTPVPTQPPTKTTVIVDPKLKQLEQHNVKEQRQLERTQLRERFIVNPQKRQEVVTQQKDVKTELQRIQEQRRLQLQNKITVEKTNVPKQPQKVNQPVDPKKTTKPVDPKKADPTKVQPKT